LVGESLEEALTVETASDALLARFRRGSDAPVSGGGADEILRHPWRERRGETWQKQ
jgi:hypothetical protein